MKKTIVALMTIALFGCATTPTPLLSAKSTPSERIYLKSSSGTSLSKAIFVRDSGLAGAGVYEHLSINGNKAASIDVSEKVEFHLPPGEYVFSVIPTNFFGEWTGYGIDQNLVEGRTYTYRILTEGSSLQTRIERVIAGSVPVSLCKSLYLPQ